ncbi:MAG: hypothetical protein KAJ13_11565 [Gemmatimonadetes bacterium]|nr:hypothetical protein [Gemmatimonadota bacterium]
MTKILLAVLVLLAGLVVFWLALAEPETVAPAMSEQAQEILEQAQIRSSRTDTLYVTARGQRLNGRGWRSDTGAQKRIPQNIVRDSVLIRERSRVGLMVGPARDSLTTVSMDATAAHEGKLFRIHVDRPSAGEGSADQIIVIGFYDKLWSSGAVDSQRVACKVCGEITVCGSRPECF